MSESLFVDANAALWFLEGNDRLSARGRSAMQTCTTRLILPVIAAAELLRVITNRERLVSANDLLDELQSPSSRFHVAPLDLEIVRRAVAMTAVSELHDQLIVATVLVARESGSQASLVTSDRHIQRCGLIDVVW